MKMVSLVLVMVVSSVSFAQNKVIQSLAKALSGPRQVATAYCSYGHSEMDAVNELQSNLASASLKFYVETKDGNNSRIELSSLDIKSVSAITIVKVDSNFSHAACVTVIGTGYPERK